MAKSYGYNKKKKKPAMSKSVRRASKRQVRKKPRK